MLSLILMCRSLVDTKKCDRVTDSMHLDEDFTSKVLRSEHRYAFGISYQ
jgi:hypothetical protein